MFRSIRDQDRVLSEGLARQVAIIHIEIRIKIKIGIKLEN